MSHISFTKFFAVKNELHLVLVVDDVSHCSVCHLSKQNHLDLIPNGHISKACFNLIHIDV